MYNLPPSLIPVLVGVGLVALLIIGLLALFKAFYIKVPQGTALIVNDMSSTPKVHFTGALVYPVIHLKEFMKISLITLEVDRRAKDGLICRDNMRADITVAFYLRVNETQEDVLKVAKAIGVERASDRAAVNELFNAKFSEALKTVGKQFDFVQLFENRQDFRDRIVEVIGNDLNGYVLEDVAIDYLEQTSKASLDPSNILDAEGIRKITELTAAQNVITNDLERNEELAIKKKNVETREATLALERQQADAEARQKREVETIRAREEAETLKVREEERLKAEQARIQTQQELDIRAENHQREVEVAQQNRQRAVVIEVEKVTRAQELEVVAREREVELQRIEKEKALEEERKNIAAVVRERVAVEKTVAQEEERIKEVREVSEAERLKQVTVLNAQAEAEQELVRQVKQAEADETRSKHKAVEINNLAQAELEAAAKSAEAKKKLAEGIEAERAAPGLADARVREITAAAKEKEGLAEARVQAERLIAEAKGEQEKGLAQARVIEAQAAAKEKDGLADAKVLEEKLGAQARGEEQLGTAKAKATQDLGMAEAQVLLERLNAEAEGLGKKFGALDALSDNARQHEEFRMQLEKSFEEAMAAIAANKDIAKDQAEVLATALAKAKIEIVGGEGDFFNSFAKSLSVGKAIEGVVGKSPVVQDVLARLLQGRASEAKPATVGDADAV
ncbi:flotillin family protein [Pseudomonas sp. sia0905]|uniref:flotillin family protein n=1 Tax=Pseudomonas sp. sia0905 TaxID=2854783 RepID=UPI001C45E314|nr:flotillin family protein [Pseudomonas sp. sia0905]MBV7564020.1 flotillin family protein [Pseudomonas sp. sia0905]